MARFSIKLLHSSDVDDWRIIHIGMNICIWLERGVAIRNICFDFTFSIEITHHAVISEAKKNNDITWRHRISLSPHAFELKVLNRWIPKISYLFLINIFVNYNHKYFQLIHLMLVLKTVMKNYYIGAGENHLSINEFISENVWYIGLRILK